MIEGRWRPCGGAMAHVALLAGRHMVARLAAGGAAVVAGRTGAGGDAAVVEGCRCPRRGPMAHVALLTGWDVVARLATSGAAVMAGGASACGDAVVAESGRRPGVVAVRAGQTDDRHPANDLP